ncbi:LOB domain-containing protein 30-like [Diospyros lotus]|uniref:LOB domain-containing protein 30-like n=1 Tax=Diospyros lotus TaxID=55363 RepID=UPI0022524BFC|nr:LOB domain-containing protein 30-like [Diospyros lotus]
MPRSNIPRPQPRCGACIVLHAQCPPRCFFAPYFSHEEGVIDFSAIHRVFGVSNASFLLYQVPARDRSEAAVLLTIEALARLQDPVYGCVSHILTLQQQVSDLQTYRAYLQDSLFVYYSSYPQPVPQPDQNPSWNFDLPIIPENVSHPSFQEATLPLYPGKASSSQMPPPDDIDELGPIVFGNRRRH